MTVIGIVCAIIGLFFLLPRTYPKGFFDKWQLLLMNAEFKKGKIEWIYRNREKMALITLFTGLGLSLVDALFHLKQSCPEG